MTPGSAVAPAVLVAASATAAAVSLLLPRHSLRIRPRARGRRGLVGLVLAPAVLAGAVLLPGRALVLATIAVGLVVAASRAVVQRRGRRAARRTTRRVLEACEEIAGELSAGRTAGQALGGAAARWGLLGPVAEAERLGADVPAAFRAAARTPGAEDLRPLGAAWQVAHRTGRGLGTAVTRVARELRAEQSLRRVVDGELASARATARLLAALPLLALLVGGGAGGDPWHFLLVEPVGLACLAGGLGFEVVGLAWIEAIAARVERGH